MSVTRITCLFTYLGKMTNHPKIMTLLILVLVESVVDRGGDWGTKGERAQKRESKNSPKVRHSGGNESGNLTRSPEIIDQPLS